MRTVSFLLFPRTGVSAQCLTVQYRSLTNDGISSIRVSVCIGEVASREQDAPEKTQCFHCVGMKDGYTVVIRRALVNHQTVGTRAGQLQDLAGIRRRY